MTITTSSTQTSPDVQPASSTAEPDARRRLARFAGRLQWVAVPLIGLLLANAWVSRIAPPRWYSRAAAHAEAGPAPKYLFIGSSRVGAAVDAEHFAQQIVPAGEAAPLAINFGLRDRGR